VSEWIKEELRRNGVSGGKKKEYKTQDIKHNHTEGIKGRNNRFNIVKKKRKRTI
jgi:hypothetical protein